MNDLAKMLDRMSRADKEKNPVKAMRILMGWTCSRCAKEFEPEPSDQVTLGLKFTMGLPILCKECRSDSATTPPA